MTSEPRVFISTDIGGADADDIQSLVHVMYYLDKVDLKGIVASPSADSNRSPSAGLNEIENVLNSYAEDYDKLRTWGDYPTPESLREISYLGASLTLEEGGELSQISPGADAIAREALAASPEDKLHVLTWGSPTDVALALDRHPEIADSLVVYTILANFGANSDKDAMDIIKSFDDVVLIDNNTTFRGMYAWDSPTYGTPDTFPTEFVENNPETGLPRDSALAEHFAEATERVFQDILKMGDTPSFLYLIDSADNNDPTLPSSWGGQFVRESENYYTDRDDNLATPFGSSKPRRGAGTVSRYADEFLGDWVSRLERAERKNGEPENDSGGGSDEEEVPDDEQPNTDTLTGGDGDDFLQGQEGDQVLIGVDPDSENPGLGERDRLSGGAGADTFVLGNHNSVFYDDNGSNLGDGWNGRAVILDFNPGDDLIELSAVGNYELKDANGSTRIFEVSDEVKDLIGVVDSVTGLDLQNPNHFVFV